MRSAVAYLRVSRERQECTTITTRSLSVAKFMLTTGRRPTLTAMLRALDAEMPGLMLSDVLSAVALILALAADPSKIMLGADKPKPSAGGAIAWLDQMIYRAEGQDRASEEGGGTQRMAPAREIRQAWRRSWPGAGS